MKNLTTSLLLVIPFLTSVVSYQDTKSVEKANLTGTWVYTQPAEEELGFTMTVDGKKVDTETDERGEDHYYLVFDDKNELIEYKVVFGFRSEYRVGTDTLYVNEEPLYEITELNSDSLTLKYLKEPKTITYTKTEQEVSDIPIMN